MDTDRGSVQTFGQIVQNYAQIPRKAKGKCASI